MNGSPLTSFQEQHSSAAVDDMAVGYPRLTAASEQWARFKGIANEIGQAPVSRDAVVDGLTTTVKKMLGISTDIDCELTFSGSIALERTISSVSTSHRKALVTVPGFDSIYAFVRRAFAQEPSYVSIDPFGRRERVMTDLLSSIDDSVGAVILVSPNNPTGFTLSAVELKAIADACATVDAVLVLDHCFILANPFSYKAGVAYDLENRCRWIALWDSSKTIDLLGEKFAMAFGSQSALAGLRHLLQETQLDLPLGTLRIMDIALTKYMAHRELQVRNEIVRQNYLTLKATCIELGYRINSPDAGSFALIASNYKDHANSISFAEKLLGDYGIALMPSRFLYPGNVGRSQEFLRVSLARPAAMVRRLCGALASRELRK